MDLTSGADIACVIGTAGHVDHGKTALVRALTGVDTDRLEEERRRGLSIELGFAFLEFDLGGARQRAAVVDVPGHERFIRNMLVGATGMDAVLFCVAADDGVMAQTREHFDIVRLLGVERGVFAVTKADLADRGRVLEVTKEIRALASGTRLEACPVLPVSAATGEGLVELRGLIVAMGVEADRPSRGPFFRLPIDRAFSMRGFGTVVTGTVASGSVRRGDGLVLFPSGRRCRARTIQSLFEERDCVRAGQRAALNLSGVGLDEAGRGQVACSTGLLPFIDAARDGRLLVECSFEFLPARSGERGRTVKNGKLLKVFHLASEALARVRFDGAKEAAPGARAYGRLVLTEPLLMMRSDRFILRDPAINATIGGGEVILPLISRELAPGALSCRPSPGQGVSDIISGLLPDGAAAFPVEAACLALNIGEDELARGLDDRFEREGGLLIIKDRLVAANKEVLRRVAHFHGRRPAEAGAGDEVLAPALSRASAGLPPARAAPFARSVLEGLLRAGALRKAGPLWALPSFRPEQCPADGRVVAALTKIFSTFPPDRQALGRLPFSRGEVDRALVVLESEGVIVRLGKSGFISTASLEEARQKMTEFVLENGRISAARMKELLGCGRNLAVEILEHFDRQQVTLRGKDDERSLKADGVEGCKKID